MKKLKFLLLVVFVTLLSACVTKRESIDEDEFISIMTNEGFNIVNIEKQFAEYGYFEEAYVAVDKSGNYQIEFYELENDSYAINFYNTNKETFEASKTGSSVYTNVDLTDSNRYTLTTEDSYKVLSRIDETVVYLNVDKEYKNEVINILKKLGY